MFCSSCMSFAFVQTDLLVARLAVQSPLNEDPVYKDKTLPLVFTCSILLPIAYLIGLVYTLRTHKHLFAKETEDAADAHHGVNWSRPKAAFLLLICTGMIALVAETIVSNVQVRCPYRGWMCVGERERAHARKTA